MDYDTDQQGYEDESRGYRDRTPRGENGDSRARSASPNGRDRMDTSRPPPPPVPTEEEEEEARNPGSNLFVTGIHPRLTEEEVSRLFEKYGTVEKCNIMRDPHTRDSRGFGFVNMSSGTEADAAKEALQGEVYEGRTLSIEKARRSKPRTPTPGKYFGPPKRDDFRGPPRGGSRYGGDRYDRGGGRDGYRSRRDEPYGGSRGGDRYGGRGGDRYDDRAYPRRDRYDDRPPRDDRHGGSRRGGGGGRDYYEGGSGRPAPSDAAPYSTEPLGASGNGGGRGYEDSGYSRR